MTTRVFCEYRYALSWIFGWIPAHWIIVEYTDDLLFRYHLPSCKQGFPISFGLRLRALEAIDDLFWFPPFLYGIAIYVRDQGVEVVLLDSTFRAGIQPAWCGIGFSGMTEDLAAKLSDELKAIMNGPKYQELSKPPAFSWEIGPAQER